MGAEIPIHHNTIGTTKGIWRISVCSAQVINKNVVVLKLELESDSGFGSRLLGLRVLTADFAALGRLAHLLDRVRDWIELTEECDAELDFSQVA